ncbi:hypothetical protein V8E51_007555 [Hyaloscypha variabilis]
MPAMQPMGIVCLQVNFASSLLPSKARLPSALPRFAVQETFLPTSTSVFLRIPLCSFPHPFPAISIPTQAQNLKILLQASILPKSVKMKSAIMLAVGAFAFAVSAQTTALPACGSLCFNNMLAKAGELNCATGDNSCLCKNPDFSYGIRDCSNAVCGPVTASSVIAYGSSFCASVTAGSGSGSGGSGTATTTDTTLTTVATGTSTTTATSGTGGAGAGAGGSSAVTTSALVTVETSGGSTFTSTTGSTTIYSTGGAGAAGGFSTAVTTSAIVTVETSGGSTFTSTIGSTTIFSSGAGVASSIASSLSSEASSAGSEASSLASKASSAGSAASHAATGTSSSSAGGARQTAFAGIAAAAGLAALII